MCDTSVTEVHKATHLATWSWLHLALPPLRLLKHTLPHARRYPQPCPLKSPTVPHPRWNYFCTVASSSPPPPAPNSHATTCHVLEPHTQRARHQRPQALTLNFFCTSASSSSTTWSFIMSGRTSTLPSSGRVSSTTPGVCVCVCVCVLTQRQSMRVCACVFLMGGGGECVSETNKCCDGRHTHSV